MSTTSAAKASGGPVRPRTIFFGTPEIAVPSLRALTRVADVVAVVCQPDRPVGRERTLHAPAVKRAAIELGVAVHQPEKVKTPEFLAWVREQRADVAVVLAYGRILTRAVLDAPRLGCINLHASLLPRYRGAAPITWSIVRGERETGFSLMQMDEGIDTGPVFCVRRIAIGPDETSDELTTRLAALGADVVEHDLPRVLAGELVATPQDDAAATLAPILTREHGLVDWSKTARSVHDHVRGMHPWPGAHTTTRGRALKVLATRVPDPMPSLGVAPGTVMTFGRGDVLVACGEGAVLLERGQLEGKKPLGGAELVRGRAVLEGEVLGA